MILKKITGYIRARRVRFLLLAVLLSLGLTLRIATFAKYNSYLSDTTSAVSDDFFFASNFLFEQSQTYQVNSFDGQDYECTIVIKNYENSLRYNHENTGFFYTLEARVYTDSACTTPDAAFTSTEYQYGGSGNLNVKATGKADANGNPIALDDPTYASGTTVNYTTVNYAYFPGMSEFDTDTAGQQSVLVKVHRTSPVSEIRYLKVTAHAYPLQYVENYLTMKSGFTFDASKYQGVYSGELGCVFELHITSGSANLTGLLRGGQDYTSCFRLSCNSGSTGTVQAKVYYNSAKLSPDSSLGAIGYDTENSLGYYIKTSVNAGGNKDLYFYKTSINTQVSYSPEDNTGDYAWKLITSSQQEEETPYPLTVYSAVGGSAATIVSGSPVSQAKQGATVTLRLTPNTGYAADGATVSVTLNGRSTSLSLRHGTGNDYTFDMAGGPVSITPTFQPTVMATVSHCTVDFGTAARNPGAQVTVVVTPEDGYDQIQATAVDGTGHTVTLSEGGSNTYTFTMPSTPVTLNVTCSQTQAGE